jgi:hypothetical protein
VLCLPSSPFLPSPWPLSSGRPRSRYLSFLDPLWLPASCKELESIGRPLPHTANCPSPKVTRGVPNGPKSLRYYGQSSCLWLLDAPRYPHVYAHMACLRGTTKSCSNAGVCSKCTAPSAKADADADADRSRTVRRRCCRRTLALGPRVLWV